ncbi:MAG: hypothetical protein FOGNACKC_04889 [Anaerolineae bacterium]|nr:hypothetical protein [Anaerolineae bacterium]
MGSPDRREGRVEGRYPPDIRNSLFSKESDSSNRNDTGR